VTKDSDTGCSETFRIRLPGAKMNDRFLKLYVAAQSILARTDGQSITEYAMAFSLIALGCVAGASAVAHGVNQTLIAMATTITTGVTR